MLHRTVFLDCGDYNKWVELALEYLPHEVFDEHSEKLAFISMAHRDGVRLARILCETREIIILSEHVLPRGFTDEGQSDVRYFIYVVLHEIAHAVKKHRSPLYDALTKEEMRCQEQEADDLAFQWFNDHITTLDNPYLSAITRQEIESTQTKNKDTFHRLEREKM